MRAARTAVLMSLACLLAACGSGGGSGGSRAGTQSIPSYVREPFSAQQKRIAAGAKLFVGDGCASCHMGGSSKRLGPSFESFAGHEIRLADGRRALVNEAFLRASILNPAAYPLRGWKAASMLRADRRLQLARHPREVADLAAFIEEIGPETG